SLEEIKNAISGADMVFITAGMGGGTGTGAAPVVARVAREMGILTVGIVTKPFAFEGKRRMDQAELGISALSEFVDSLVIIPNERLKQVSESRITLLNAFEISDDVLRHGVQSISELINVPGFVNLDFADVTAVMKDAGYAHMGVGEGTGKDKAEIAAKAAISSPLLETSISGANGILINITASPDIGLEDIDLASTMITNEASDNATVIWGASFDPELEDKMKITIIATGFANDKEKLPKMDAKAAAPAPAQEEKKAEVTAEENEFAPTEEEKNGELPEVEPSAISEDDFNELMGMLKKQKNPGNGGF
ncbi:MAG: cell division protein FtsZ, partial [Lachnospiraceae bacterium]